MDVTTTMVIGPRGSAAERRQQEQCDKPLDRFHGWVPSLLPAFEHKPEIQLLQRSGCL
jgi:hypothetical protein